METHCVRCRKKTQRFLKQTIIDWLCNQYVLSVKVKCQGLWKKKKEAKGLLSNLGIKTPLSKVKCFVMYKNEWHCEQIFTGRW